MKAFEAAARHASVTKAAAELAVSHSAVSQQLKLLEEYFGQPLFVRSGRGISPTPQAAAFLEHVCASFDRLAVGSEQLMRASQSNLLRVNTTPSFAMRWLIPNSSKFQLENPSLDLQISTSSNDGISGLNETFDFIIRRDKMTKVDYSCIRFLDDVSTVVMSPHIEAIRKVEAPSDLLSVPLLHLKSRPDSWQRWFKESGVEICGTPSDHYFEHFFVIAGGYQCIGSDFWSLCLA